MKFSIDKMINIIDENIDKPFSEILILSTITLEIVEPQLRKNNWKQATRIGNIILLNPIIPEPNPTHTVSADKANPRNRASLESMQLELSIS